MKKLIRLLKLHASYYVFQLFFEFNLILFSTHLIGNELNKIKPEYNWKIGVGSLIGAFYCNNKQ